MVVGGLRIETMTDGLRGKAVLSLGDGLKLELTMSNWEGDSVFDGTLTQKGTRGPYELVSSSSCG